MQGKSERAYDEFSELGKNIAELEEILGVKVSKELGLSLRNFKKFIKKIFLALAKMICCQIELIQFWIKKKKIS